MVNKRGGDKMAISMFDKNRKYLKKDDIIKYDHDYYWLDYNKEKQHWVLIGLSTERIITPPGLVALLAKSERIGTINNEPLLDLIILYQEEFLKGE